MSAADDVDRWEIVAEVHGGGRIPGFEGEALGPFDSRAAAWRRAEVIALHCARHKIPANVHVRRRVR